MILVFCLAVFGNHHSVGTETFPTQSSISGFIKVLGVSLISVFFTYGWISKIHSTSAPILNGPVKIFLKQFFFGMGIIIILYLLINISYYTVLGFAGMQHAKLLAAELAGSFFGPFGYTLTSIAIFISVLGFINTSLLSNPRVYFAMAEDGILPAIFKKVNPETMAQEFGLSFFVALIMLSLFLLGTFEKILNYVMFIDSLSMVSAAGTIFIFRRRKATPDKEIYKVNGYPFVPLIFMAVVLFVSISVLCDDPKAALYGFIIFLSGFPLYHILKKIIAKSGNAADAGAEKTELQDGSLKG